MFPFWLGGVDAVAELFAVFSVVGSLIPFLLKFLASRSPSRVQLTTDGLTFSADKIDTETVEQLHNKLMKLAAEDDPGEAPPFQPSGDTDGPSASK